MASECHSKPQGGPARRVYSSTPLTLFAWLRARVRPSVVHVHVHCSQQRKHSLLFGTNLCIHSKLHHLCDLNSIYILRYCPFGWNFDNLLKIASAFLWLLYMGEKQILRKRLQRSSLMLFFWVWKSGDNTWNQFFLKCTLFAGSTVHGIKGWDWQLTLQGPSFLLKHSTTLKRTPVSVLSGC